MNQNKDVPCSVEVYPPHLASRAALYNFPGSQRFDVFFNVITFSNLRQRFAHTLITLFYVFTSVYAYTHLTYINLGDLGGLGGFLVRVMENYR